MIKSLIKVISIPIVYIVFIGLAIFKWIFLAPIAFTLSLLKHALIWIIVGVVAGFFLTPIATLIIVVIYIISSLSTIVSDMSNGFFGSIRINWDYAFDIFSDNKYDALVRKRKKLLITANKKYRRAIDEFAGFNAIADIYRN